MEKRNKKKYLYRSPALGIVKPNINSLISISNRIIGVILVIIIIIISLNYSQLFDINEFVVSLGLNKKNFIINNSKYKEYINFNILILQILVFLILYHINFSWIKVESILKKKQNLVNKNVNYINNNYLLILLFLIIIIYFILWIIINNYYLLSNCIYILVFWTLIYTIINYLIK